jgi:hypothetical protein
MKRRPDGHHRRVLPLLHSNAGFLPQQAITSRRQLPNMLTCA